MSRERLVVIALFGAPVVLAAMMMAWSAVEPASAQTTGATKSLGPFVGLVQPSDEVDLASVERGTIQEITIEEGVMVKKGQVICKLDSTVEEAALKISQTQAESEIDIESAKLRHDLAQIEVTRLADIDKVGAAARKELDTADINEKYSASLVRKAQHDQRVAKFQYARDQKVLQRRTIVSTLDGYVAKKKKSPGELVDGQDDTVVCQIAKLDPLHLVAPVPASTYGQIRLNDRATLAGEQLPQGKATGKVILVDKLVQSDSQTYNIKIELPNPGSVIPSGIKVEVNFP
jgi:RND family efflux transporter MFP subunit